MSNDRSALLLAVAWLVALLATLYSQYTLQIQSLLPCTWCWYQWVLLYPQTIILGVATWRGDYGIRHYALPFNFIGIAVGLYTLSQPGCTTNPACVVALVALVVITLCLAMVKPKTLTG